MLLRGSRFLAAPLQASCIAMAGDAMCQTVLGNGEPLDRRRTLAFGAFGFCYGGLFQRWLYGRMDVLLGVGRNPSVVVSKVLADALVHAPLIYIPAFYISIALLRGDSLSAGVAQLRDKWAETMRAYFAIWPATMAMVFAYVPVHRRVLCVASVAFVEKTVLSAIANDELPASWSERVAAS
jgi:protein Mpv17|tara:strand:- start:811 stop:1353 length:543 start_codon:yes stop_codon:yes gene_type:complete